MELYGRTDCNVRRIAWAGFQARVLEFDWIVKADTVLGQAPWTDYPVVTYTPPDLFCQFVGIATDPARQYKAGETIRITCADVWRKWERTSARLDCEATTPVYGLPGTSKIRIREGVFIHDALNSILAANMSDIPGGFSFALANVTDPPNPDAPTTVVNRGVFSRLNTYAIHDIVTYLGKTYIAVTIHLPWENTPDWQGGWDLYYPYAPTPHAPIMYTTQDKTGQKLATWIHDILDQTDNGVALIDYVGNEPRLNVYDYSAPAAVTLKQGAYDVINPDDVNPLMQSGEIKPSQNNKYQKIIVEGAGKFTRRQDALTPVFCGSQTLPGDQLEYNYRFYFPSTNVIGTYIDGNNLAEEVIRYRFVITNHPNHVATTTDTGLQQLTYIYKDTDQFLSNGTANPYFGRYYAPWAVLTTTNDTTAPTFGLAEFWYTSYDGPLIAQMISPDPNLAGAGDFPVHMPKWYKYDSDGLKVILRDVTSVDPGTGDTITVTNTIYATGNYPVLPFDRVTILEAVCHRDYTPSLKAVAKAYYSRYCNTVDYSGTLQVIVKGNVAGIQIGTPITNFNNARVQSIDVNPMTQSMKLTISDQLIREWSYKQRDYLALRSELYGNSRNRVYDGEDVPQFPDLTLDDACNIVYVEKLTPPPPPPPPTAFPPNPF